MKFRTCLYLLVALLAVPGLNAVAQMVTGDHVKTRVGDLIIHPINHATFAMSWSSVTVYVDPVGGAAAFQGLPAPDLILITHAHSDHFDPDTLTAIAKSADIIAPAAVVEMMPAALKGQTATMANGAMMNKFGINIEAVPAYNTTEDRLQFHPKGSGNGYVLTMADKRIYISGDTEDIPEMRALKNIDVAFVCFNLPYTMTEEKAASAVNDFKPGIVYPYHYRGSDLDKFASMVDKGIEVRRGAWY